MMKKIVLLFAFMMVAFSIASHAQKNKSNRANKAAPQNESFKEVEKVTIADSTLYSKKFIEGLRSTQGKTYILKDSIMIVTGADRKTDTVHFPSELPLHKTQYLVGRSRDTSFVLEIKRINYSTISYNLHVTQNIKPFNEFVLDAGELNLSPSFFLAPEVMKDEKGVAHKADVYISVSGDCHVSIRIGRNDKGAFITTLERDCGAGDIIRSPLLRPKG